MKKTEEQWLLDMEERAAERQRMLSMMGDLQNGAIFRSARRDDAWCMVIPDLDGEGQWRLQYFDRRGFSGHSVYPDQDKARYEAVMEGFYLRDDEALDRLQETHEFKRGNFATDLIGKINTGEIAFAELNQRLAEYDLQHQPVLH